jgi:endonuclease III
MAQKRSAKKKPPTIDAKLARRMLDRLKKQFPEARTALSHENAFQLLVATILSAQCTDERVNKVTPALFAKYPDPAAFARTAQEELEQDIRSTGFFRMKAKNIIGCSRALMERFAGKVPTTMEELVSLPGVGRKTANVVLSEAFGLVEGIVVDTHVRRLSRRMGFSKSDTPELIEQDLMKLFPQSDWTFIGRGLILHGRQVCNARKPACPECVINALCPSSEA